MWTKFRMPEEYLKARVDDPTFKRWASCVVPAFTSQAESVLLRGYANDAGIMANGGRSGAAKGPTQFRKAFYSMPRSLGSLEIIDEGDFTAAASVVEAHKQAKGTMLKQAAALTVSVGGGHDWALVDFEDIADVQIIHIDTHLDVRPFEKDKLHSGMPFRALVEKGAHIWCMGAQREYSTQEQWDFAQGNFKGLFSLDDIEKDFLKSLDICFTAINPLKPLALSIDLDAFPQSISPGVSAPAPRGVSLKHVVQIIDAVAKNLNAVGIYELNPAFDQDEQSARLAAYLVSRILQKKFS